MVEHVIGNHQVKRNWRKSSIHAVHADEIEAFVSLQVVAGIIDHARREIAQRNPGVFVQAVHNSAPERCGTATKFQHFRFWLDRSQFIDEIVPVLLSSTEFLVDLDPR